MPVKCALFGPTRFCDLLIFNQLSVVLSRQIWYLCEGLVYVKMLLYVFILRYEVKI